MWPERDDSSKDSSILIALVVVCLVLALLAGCGGGGGNDAPPPAVVEPTPEPTPNPFDPWIPPPLAQPAPPVDCGPGLAATDLSGNCRANPPTPGALEAVPSNPQA